MRILFAAHQFLPEHHAGTEMMTLAIARELKARGHEPHVLAAKRSVGASGIDPGAIEDYDVEGIPVRRVGRPPEGFKRPYELDYRNDLIAARARKYAEAVVPDIVHVMHLQGLSASVLPISKELGLPVVFMATDFWSVCPVVDLRRHDGVMCTGPEIDHCVRCLVKKRGGPRAERLLRWTPRPALSAGVKLADSPLRRASFALRQTRALAERPEHIRERLDFVDRVITPSRFMRDMLLRNDVGAGKTEVSRHGIDTSSIERTPRRPGLPRPLRIGFIGTLGPHKGCDVLIRAFRLLPPELGATLTIHGNLQCFAPFVSYLRELVGDQPGIVFAGPFPPNQAGSALADMDVLAIPSRWYENAPLVIPEAFAAGVPVVATDLGGMAEAVEPEVNGLLFELEDHDDLARQLRRLGEEDGLLDRLRDGTGTVKTIQQDVDEMEALYESLVHGIGVATPPAADADPRAL